MVEARKFQMHEKLLLDVIMRQAGSLEKAALEGVMNSIEAGSEEVHVKLTTDTFYIKDSGRGFKNKKEIEDWFETFGQPHEESENKRWAQFRMGRGQLFAFGKNRWRTGEFQMDVDIKTRLGYDLKTDLPEHSGCDIEVELYTPISDREISYISREIGRYVKYVSVPVFVNEVQVNTPPEKEKWGKDSTEDAYIKLTDSSKGIELYNLGVFVCSFPVYEYGTSGVVVTKKKIDVNFARNSVIKSCPVFKRIKEVIDQSDKVANNRQKKELTDGERQHLVDSIVHGELKFEDYKASKIFVDTNGYAWSYNSIVRGRFQNWTFTNRNSSKANILLQRGTLVLEENNFDNFGCEPEELISKVFEHRLYNFTYIPFETLSNYLDNSIEMLPAAKWTPTMHMWKYVIKQLQSEACGYRVLDGLVDDQRQITFMSAVNSCAITDGSSYIAFGREFLERNPLFEINNKHALRLKSVLNIFETLIHEMAHSYPTSGDHDHGPEFNLTYRAIMEKNVFSRAVGAVMGNFSAPTRVVQLKKRCQEECRKAKKLGKK